MLYFVLTNVPVLVFCEFPRVSLNCGSVSVLGRQHICKQHGEEVDSKCWVRPGPPMFSWWSRCVFWEATMSRAWPGGNGKTCYRKYNVLLPPAFVQGLQFWLGTEQCCFFTSFLICHVTCEKEVHRWSSSFEPNLKNNILSQL